MKEVLGETKWMLESSRAPIPQLEIVAAGILEHSRSVEMELPEVLPEDI